MQHGGGKSNWGAVDKAALHSTPEVVADALGPIPSTTAEKALEPESTPACCHVHHHCHGTISAGS